MQEDAEVLTSEEAAELLRVSTKTILALARDGVFSARSCAFSARSSAFTP